MLVIVCVHADACVREGQINHRGQRVAFTAVNLVRGRSPAEISSLFHSILIHEFHVSGMCTCTERRVLSAVRAYVSLLLCSHTVFGAGWMHLRGCLICLAATYHPVRLLLSAGVAHAQ